MVIHRRPGGVDLDWTPRQPCSQAPTYTTRLYKKHGHEARHKCQSDLGRIVVLSSSLRFSLLYTSRQSFGVKVDSEALWSCWPRAQFFPLRLN